LFAKEALTSSKESLNTTGKLFPNRNILKILSRRCGKAVCGNCSQNSKEDIRICAICVNKKENIEKEIKRENRLSLNLERFELRQELFNKDEKKLEELVSKKNDRKWRVEI